MTGNLPQQFQGTCVCNRGEVETSLEGLDIELKWQSFGSTAQIGVVVGCHARGQAVEILLRPTVDNIQINRQTGRSMGCGCRPSDKDELHLSRYQ